MIGDRAINLTTEGLVAMNVRDCGDRGLCQRRPCRNGATCTDVSPTEYRCTCAEGFTGGKNVPFVLHF